MGTKHKDDTAAIDDEEHQCGPEAEALDARSSGLERPDDRELEKVPPSLRSECNRRGVGSSDQDQIGITVHLRRRQHRLYRQTVRWF